MNKDFEMNSSSTAVGPIHVAVYNENSGEILTVGADFITVSRKIGVNNYI